MNIRELRQSARLIWEAALSAANPATCIRNFVQADDNMLSVGGKRIEIRGRLIVIGAGKPSARMAQVIEEILGSHITGGLVVTKYGHSLPLHRIKLVEAGQPMPDNAGNRAAPDTRELLARLTADYNVRVLTSGDAAALWTAGAEGLT